MKHDMTPDEVTIAILDAKVRSLKRDRMVAQTTAQNYKTSWELTARENREMREANARANTIIAQQADEMAKQAEEIGRLCEGLETIEAMNDPTAATIARHYLALAPVQPAAKL